MLTGPAGAAKTTTLRILSKEMRFDILEWQNSIDDGFVDGDLSKLTLPIISCVGG